jgi:outer membrane murein-binding lipoprotein Lpp
MFSAHLALQRLLTVALAGLLILSGCEATGPFGGQAATTQELTPAEKQLREDGEAYNRVVLGGAAVGAAAGAAVGALSCLFADSKDRGRCALQRGVIGGAVGGIAGAIDGYYTAKKQQAAQQKVREIDLVTRDVRNDNTRLVAFIHSSDTVLAESRSKLAQVNRDVSASKMSVQQARAEQARIEQNRDLMQQTLENTKKSRDVYQQTSAKMPTTAASKRDLDAEIRKLNQEIAALEKNVVAMNSALAVSKV